MTKKKNTGKRRLSMLLILSMCLSIIATPALAETQDLSQPAEENQEQITITAPADETTNLGQDIDETDTDVEEDKVIDEEETDEIITDEEETEDELDAEEDEDIDTEEDTEAKDEVGTDEKKTSEAIGEIQTAPVAKSMMRTAFAPMMRVAPREGVIATVGEDEVTTVEELKEAISSATDSVNITLLSNINLDNSNLSIDGKNVTLDLGEYTISSNKTAISISQGANVTIHGNGSIVGTSYGLFVKGAGTIVTVESGSISGGYGIVASSGAGLNIKGGTIKGENIGIHAQLNSWVNVEDGTIEGVNIGLNLNSEGSTTPVTATVDGANTIIRGTKSPNGGYGIGVYGSTSSFKDVSIDAANEAMAKAVATELIVKNGTISGTEMGIAGNGASHFTNITIEGGNISSDKVGLYHPQYGVLNITGNPIITGVWSGIEIRAGKLNITGNAHITATEVSYISQNNGNGATAHGAALAIAQHTTKLPIEVNVSDGTFNGARAISLANPQSNAVTDLDKISATISGGNFSSDTTSVVNDENIKNFIITGGTFTDTSADQYRVVAAIGDAYYTSLQAAVDAAGTNTATITLLDDTIGNGVIVKGGQNITFDLAGHSYTVDPTAVGSTGTETNGFQLLEGSNVTFSNGTLKPGVAKILIQNYSNLTINDVTLECVNSNCAYAISNNCGQVNITGNTSINNPAGTAFDVCWAPTRYPAGAQVTVNTSGTINGKVECDVWDDDGASDVLSTLNIQNGNFTGIIDGKDRFGGKISITGGTFTDDICHYVAYGYAQGVSTGTVSPLTITIPTLSISVGDEATAFTTTPSNVKLIDVSWSTGDDSIAIMSSEGTIIGVAGGNTTVTVTANGVTATGTVRVLCANHNYTSTVTTEPTYTATGIRTYVCDVCGNSYTETIPMLYDGGDYGGYDYASDPANNTTNEGTTGGSTSGSTGTTGTTGTTNTPTVEIGENGTPLADTPTLFDDVASDAWYHDVVADVVGRHLMGGVAERTFAPTLDTSRAMLVTMLHRLEGAPSIEATTTFADVPSDEWFAAAVNWAAANNIVHGYSEDTFAPNNAVTREQLAAILYGYSASKGYDVTQSADLSGFADSDQIGDWAVESMRWAVATGLIKGVDADTLNPGGTASRAEVAAIMSRFCVAFVK